jgi:tetratricopeptide (TPR) repeat protein
MDWPAAPAKVPGMTSAETAASSSPTPDEVRDELTRITASDVFNNSPQLVSFLTFIVEAALNGKSDRLKGYVIAVEVLRRDAQFDPQIDPIVRVEATRLRRALARYYSGAGAGDDVLIEIPLGGYVPAFSRRNPAHLGAAVESGRPIGWRQGLASMPRSRQVAAAVLLAAAAMLAAISLWRGGLSRPLVAESLPARNDVAAPLRGNGLPTLLVNRFDVVGTPGPQSLASDALRAKLTDAFSRFDSINITAELPRGQTADYALNGLVEYHADGSATVGFRLQDMADGVEIWSRSFERIASGQGRATAENALVLELASSLMQPFGIVRSREHNKYLADPGGDPRSRCLLLTADSFRSFDIAEHEAARSCLERLTSIDKSFADGFSYLAAALNREFIYGFGRNAADPHVLDQALGLARRGIELSPANARAYQVLSTILFSRRETKEAFAAAERAVALNQYDLIILGEYGGRLVTVGQVDRGMKILAQSADYGTVRPSWHHFYLFLGNYVTGNFAEAGFHADQMANDAYPHGLVARALTAAHNGDQARQQRALQKLVGLRPAWRDDARGELERLILAQDIVERLARDLEATGLRSVQVSN